MKRTRSPFHSLFLAQLVLFTLSTGVAFTTEGDPVFRAMKDELDRSMDSLVIEDMPRPYFLSYLIQDTEQIVIAARLGALIQTKREVDRFLYVQMRVGTPEMDNSNYIGSWRDIYEEREGIVEEDDYSALRHQIWLETDSAYKNALENLARKKAYLKTHPVKTDVPDFTGADMLDHVESPVLLETDRSKWENCVRRAADAFNENTSLEDWNVRYRGMTDNRRYVNSDGGMHLKGALYHLLEVSATVRAEDGQRLTNFLHIVSRDAEEPPSGVDLVGKIEEMAEVLEAMAGAPILEEYAGPVLFTGFASAQFLSQLFVNQLALTRKPISTEDWWKDSYHMGKFPGRLNRRIFPRFINIHDRPTRRRHDDRLLLGYQVVDDEGVKSRDITIVKEGRLIDLPMCRQPYSKIRESNGHARTLKNRWTIPVVTNLFVDSSERKSMNALLKELRKLSREAGMDYGLLVRTLDDSRYSEPYMWTEKRDDGPPLLTHPVIMYRVYAEDGRMEPVRGLDFDEVSIRNLKDIIATGRDEQVFGLSQGAPFRSHFYPASIITPSFLVEEMEFSGISRREPLPVSENPIFE